MADERIILCLNCGQQNRLKANTRPHLARCGRCGEPLASLQRNRSGARLVGLISLLLVMAVGGVRYLIYSHEPHSKHSAPTPLSMEQVYGDAPEPSSAAASSGAPAPRLKPPALLAEASCELTARPANGAVLLRPEKGVIDNGTSADAVVKLRQGRDVASFYVHNRSTAKLHSVPEGDFEILFATGHNYSKKYDKFIIDFTAWRFPGIHSFESKIDGDLIYTTVMEFTLHEVIQGNISRERIPDSDWSNG